MEADRPAFHVAPRCGWLNDPNGLIVWKGRFHVFYQHVEAGCEWNWGLVWGHAVSEDLVHWRHLPPALRPTPGSPDNDGCWSGCCALGRDGLPALLYTGVRLRSSPGCGPLPPPDQDLGLNWIETQCAAVLADLDDELLVNWRKVEPILPLPPPGLGLTGWRDPFVLDPGATPSGGFAMLLGSGFQGQGGALLVYQSQTLLEGWEYVGPLCAGQGAGTPGGSVWECPFLLPLPPALAEGDGGGKGDGGEVGQPSGGQWVLAASPYPAVSPHKPSNPVLYWTGTLEEALPDDPPPPAQPSADDPPPPAQPSADDPPPAQPNAATPPAVTAAPAAAAGGGGGGISSPPPSAAATAAAVEREGSASDAEDPNPAAASAHLAPAPPPPVPHQPLRAEEGRPGGLHFSMSRARGPFRLDLGDVFYAPNVCRDSQGRWLLWGWVQERRRPSGSYSYSGCLTLPRVLSAGPGGRLRQAPAPEVKLLRRGPGWHACGLQVEEGQPLALGGLPSLQLDIEITFQRTSAGAATGLLFRGYSAEGDGDAALLYHWGTNRLGLHWHAEHLFPPEAGAEGDAAEVLAELASPLASPTRASQAAPGSVLGEARRSLGGELHPALGDSLTLRVLLDHSCLEVFTGEGQALTTRMYRGPLPEGAADSGVSLVALGGGGTVQNVSVWPMEGCWLDG